jgi:hypothetical protein
MNDDALHDATLDDVSFDWRSGVVELRLTTTGGRASFVQSVSRRFASSPKPRSPDARGAGNQPMRGPLPGAGGSGAYASS